jgi:hypothetical protein
MSGPAKSLPVDGALQVHIIERYRGESVLDRSVPLGVPAFGRPEVGLTCAEYYARKHERVSAYDARYWFYHTADQFGKRR